MDEVGTSRHDLDRRAVLRRGVVLGGMVAWTAPVVQTIAGPAFAAGSPRCDARLELADCTIVFDPSPDCCECIGTAVGEGMSPEEAVSWCAAQQRCIATETCGEEVVKPPPRTGTESSPGHRQQGAHHPTRRGFLPSSPQAAERAVRGGLPPTAYGLRHQMSLA